MSRPLRIEYEGAYYHIIQRGIERKNILKDEKEKNRFLGYIEIASQRYKAKIHTYCLMDNHYHLIVETPEANISQIMHYLNASYATYYNTKHKRVGPLFQGRYKTVLVQNDEYLWELSRYVHNNPVRAKIVNKAEEYKWSSYGSYIGKVKTPKWLEIKFILRNFGKRGKESQLSYKNFVEKKITEETDIKRDTYGGIIYGNAEFIKFIIDTYLKKREDRGVPELRMAKTAVELSKADIEKEVKLYEKDDVEVRKKTIYFLRKYTSKKLSEIAECYDGIGIHAVSKIYMRMEKDRARTKSLDKMLSKLEKKIEAFV